MSKKVIISAGIIFVLASVKPVFACTGPGCIWPSPTAFPTPTEYPTATPYPTATLFPTWTPYPTVTLYPTETPFPTGAPETGPEDISAVPILLGIGGLGIGIRKIAEKIW